MNHLKSLKKLLKPVRWLFPMKEQKILFLICLAFIPLVVYLAYEDSFAKVCLYDSSCEVQYLGLSFFYRDVQEIGFNLMFVFSLLLLIPSLYAYQTLKEKNNLFKTMIIQRISYKKYLQREIMNNFIKTFIVVMLIYIYTLFIVNIFVPIEFNFAAINWKYVYDPAYQRYYELFSNNSFVSTVIYIILVSFGYAVFSNFILSLQVLIKNLYIFRIIGVLTLILFVTGSSLLSSILANIVGSEIVTIIITPFVVGFLLNPGIMSFGGVSSLPSIVWYVIVIVVYLFVSYVLFKITEKRWLEENV